MSLSQIFALFKSKKKKKEEEYQKVAKRVMINTKHITSVMAAPKFPTRIKGFDSSLLPSSSKTNLVNNKSTKQKLI